MQEHDQFHTAFKANGSRDFTNYISHLRCDGTWGGNPEITELSEILKSPMELYRNSGIQVFKAENFHGTVNPTIRIYFANHHYSSIRPDGVGGQLFNFQALQPGELEKQMALLGEGKKIQNCIHSEQGPSANEFNFEEAKKQSKAIAEAFSNYLEFYMGRIIKQNSSQQQ